MKSFDAGTLLRLMPCILAACAAGCSAKQEPAVEPINTNDVRWGEVTNGLQMGIVVEPSFGVVQCWLRNGETNEVAYNSWSLGYWECIGLELRDGTNWLRLARSPALRGYEGIGPSIGKVIRLKPGEVISLRASGSVSPSAGTALGLRTRPKLTGICGQRPPLSTRFARGDLFCGLA